jgi:Icc-related predicted phosphoesterase
MNRTIAEARRPMRILAISDIEDPYIWEHFDADRYRDIDLVISCGDLKPEYLRFLVTLIHAPLLYVPGNHDGRYDADPPEGCENIDGRLVTVQGLRIVGLGGSHRYNLGPNQYTQKEMDRRARRLRWAILRNGGFDILVSHAPALGLGDAKDPCHVGFRAFTDLIDRYRPRYFLHGHQHLNYGPSASGILVRGSTTIINAYRHRILTV